MINEQEIMQIIMYGGDSRANCIKAIRSARNEKFEEADALLKSAKDSLIIAHEVQTKLIQSEIRGESTAVSLLMVHAQDHLMNAMTIKDLSIEMIENIKLRVNLEKKI